MSCSENRRVQGVEEEEISAGFVLSSVTRPVPCVTVFEAQLAILDLLDHKSIFSAG
jgi:peptide chain release factor subunit 3